ncbi:MAG: ADYC domain-containing protein, partial [Alphaproteobacteria bacterium]
MATGRAAFALTVALAAAPAAAQSPALRSVEVQATGFRAVWSDGTVRAGAALVGAVLTLAADPPIRLRIDAVEADPGDPDILLHRLSVREGDGPWRNLCEPDADGIAAGFPLAGASDDAGYDPDAPGFTLTCT